MSGNDVDQKLILSTTKGPADMPLDIFVNNLLPLLTISEAFNLLFTCKALHCQFSSAFVYIGTDVTMFSRTSQYPQVAQIELIDPIIRTYSWNDPILRWVVPSAGNKSNRVVTD
jgi:hypothetical protein